MKRYSNLQIYALIILVSFIISLHPGIFSFCDELSVNSPSALAVVPFREGASQRPSGDAICTLTGVHFTPGRVEKGAGIKLAALVLRYIQENLSYNTIPLENSRQALAQTNFYLTGKYNLSLGVQLGKQLNVRYLVMGVVARYREREGGRFFASKPASVAFSIALIDVVKAKIVWMDSFDKTQKSIMSDILDPDIPLSRRFVWLTADELAEIGVDKVMKNFPEARKESYRNGSEK